MNITQIFLQDYMKNFLKDEISWNDIQYAMCNNKYLEKCGYNHKCFSMVKGYIFEHIIKHLLIKKGYKYTYLFKEIPDNIKIRLNLPSCDIGVDIIASDDNINFTPIQCKWRSNENKCNEARDISHFVCSTKDMEKVNKIFATNVKKISTWLKNEQIEWYNYETLINNIDIDFVKSFIDNTKIKKNITSKQLNQSLYKHQKEVIGILLNDTSNKKQCLMACGSGKSRVMLEYIIKLNISDKKILMMFPSLQLINQMYYDIKNMNINVNIICVCSDLNINEKDENIQIVTNLSTINLEKNTIVLCTYTSSKSLTGFEFNIGIYDEAHRTVNNDTFGYTLFDNNCKILTRIFFTATAKFYKNDKNNSEICYGMDNEIIYGKNVYNYSFKNAINDGIITDFNVLCYSVPEYMNDIISKKYIEHKGINVDTNIIVSCVQILQYLKTEKSPKKIVTYHNKIKNSVNFASTLKYILHKGGVDAKIFTIDGDMNLQKRNDIIDEFSDSEITSVICSARVLNEGINIPCIDTVVFVNSRSSTIDVTQCVGRGLRLYPGKEKCNVIIPIYYDSVKKESNINNVIMIMMSMGDIDDNVVGYFAGDKKTSKIKMINTELVVGDLSQNVEIYNNGDVDKITKKLKNVLITKEQFKKYLEIDRYYKLIDFINTYGRIPENINDEEEIFKLLCEIKEHMLNYNKKIYDDVKKCCALNEYLINYMIELYNNSSFNKYFFIDPVIDEIKQNVKLFKYIKNQTDEMCLEIIKHNGVALRHVINQTEKMCIEAVKQNWRYIKYIRCVENITPSLCSEITTQENFTLEYKYVDKYQTKDLCIESVKQNGSALKYVINQTPEICLNAVQQNGDALQYAVSQTDEICLIAVKQNGNMLEYVTNQTNEICLIAVQQCGLALKHVINQTDEICSTAVERDVCALQYVKNQTREMCLKAVKKLGYLLKYVISQDEEICVEAIKNHCGAYKYVKNYTDKIYLVNIKKNFSVFKNQIYLEAVKKNKSLLMYTENQTEEMYLNIVKNDSSALKYIKNKTEKICLEAVKQNGMALLYIKNQTDEICLEAIKQNGYALLYIKNQTDEICLEAVKQNGSTLKYVENKTEKICLEAVKQHGLALFCIKNQTTKICIEAVKQNGVALKYVKNQTEEICLEAVKQTGHSLIHVKNQTEEICLEAVKKNGCMLKHVDNQTEEICSEAVKQFKKASMYIKIKIQN